MALTKSHRDLRAAAQLRDEETIDMSLSHEEKALLQEACPDYDEYMGHDDPYAYDPVPVRLRVLLL